MHWCLDKRVVCIEVAGRLDSPEFRAINETLISYLDQGTAPVHLLCDLTHLEFAENAIDVLPGEAISGQHPAFGWIVFYGSQSLQTQNLARLIAQLANVKPRVVLTRNDGFAFLRLQDPTLPM